MVCHKNTIKWRETEIEMRLSQRLEMVASYVPRGSRVADVGTDHGYVPIWLVEHGIADHAIALDVRKGPLMRAREHIKQHKLENRIETRLGDGLLELRTGEADTVVISGMGGELMLRILRDGSHVWDSVSRFILSPQSELEIFRRGLKSMGFAIEEENMLREDGKYYTVMVAVRGSMHYEEEFRYRYGDCLIRGRSPVLRESLDRERQKLLQIKERLALQNTEGAKDRRREVEEELRQVKEAYDAMQ